VVKRKLTRNGTTGFYVRRCRVCCSFLSFFIAVNDLQCLGDQSDLAGLGPEDLYVMQYLTITDDPDLLDKLLEIEAPLQQLLKDATRRYENAERTKKTLAGSAAMAAYTEPGADANAVGRGRGRGRGCGSEPGTREKAPWVRDPNLPYTQEQCKKILSWYNVRDLYSKCGTKKKKGEKHVCRASNSTCKKCKLTGHFDTLFRKLETTARVTSGDR
jgi:hypothetical protein